MFRHVSKAMAAGLVAGCLAACAGPAFRCTAPDDIPPYLYGKGMEALDDGAFRLAEGRFDRAIFCDSGFSPGYAGLALVYAEEARSGRDGKPDPTKELLSREYLDKAYRHADGQQDLFYYLVAKIRAARLTRGTAWLEEAEGAWQQAGKLSCEDRKLLYYNGKDAADYYMGLAYLDAFDFIKARERFAAARKREGKWQDLADTEWRWTDKIVRALSGSSPGDIGVRLVVKDSISRAELAALLVDELKILTLFTAGGAGEPMAGNPVKLPVDAASDPFRKEIEAVVNLKVRGLEPQYDGTSKTGLFKPGEGVSRGEMAVILHDVMTRVRGTGKTVSTSATEGSTFPDVRSSSPVFPAVAAVVRAGIMEADTSGDFRVNDIVDGPEALLAMRVMKEKLK